MAGDASWGRTGSGRKRPRTLQPRRSARPWAPSEETSVATCLVTFAEIGKPRGFALLGSDRGWNPFLSPALPPGRGRCRLPVRGQWRPPLWPLCRTPDAAPGRGQRARAQCRLAPNGAARAPPPRGVGGGGGAGDSSALALGPLGPRVTSTASSVVPGGTEAAGPAPRPSGPGSDRPAPKGAERPSGRSPHAAGIAMRRRRVPPVPNLPVLLSPRRSQAQAQPRAPPPPPCPPPPLLHAARALAGETSSSLCFYDWVVSS